MVNAATGLMENKVRLRLHYGGRFTQVPGEASGWRYTMPENGGCIFNIALAANTTYNDFCYMCNMKANCECSIKYQSPGEPLAPDSLVTVSDDDDLQELFNEYLDALQRPGTEQRTFRIHVFLHPALVYENAVEDGERLNSIGCEEDGLEFDPDEFDEVSCDPSSDTNWQPGSSRPYPMTPSAAATMAAAAGASQLHARQARMAGSAMELHGDPHRHHGYPGGGVGPSPLAQPWGTAAGMPDSAWGDGVDAATPHAAMMDPAALARVGYGDGVPDEEDGLFTADDFHVEDPYMEENSPLRAAGPQKGRSSAPAGAAPGPAAPAAGLHDHEAAGAGSAAAAADNQEDVAAAKGNDLPDGLMGPGKGLNTKGTPLYNRLLSSKARDAAGGLPSHISAFGDGGSRDGSLRLPSRISAFGLDGTEQEEDIMVVEDAAQQEEPGMRAWNVSRCITQEFEGERTASMQHLSQEDDDNRAAGKGMGDNNPASGSAAGCPPTPKVLEQAGAKVPRSDVSNATKIGEGAFGEVSCATVFPFGTVAIKWLKKDRFAKYSESFQREAEVLARLNHPHIIRMYGLVTEPTNSPPTSLITSASAPVEGMAAGGGAGGAGELLPRTHSANTGGIIIAGIMMEYLRGGSLAQRFRSLAQSGRRLNLRERCLIAKQAALGMSYLHGQSPAVIHFDLKPDNLLLEGEGEGTIVKVADFGLSKHKIQSYVTCHDLRGTLPYMAPELVKCPNQVCEKCDVWSMGVVMWEMVTLEVPFQELTAQDILRGLMQGTLHLRTPASCEPEWQQLIKSCMELEPQKRPTFRQLSERLEEMYRRLPTPCMQTVSSGPSSGMLGAQQPQQQLVQQQQVFVGQPQQHVLVAHQQQHAVVGAAAAAGLMQQLQRQQQMELEHQQQQQQQQQAAAAAAAVAAAAAAAPFAHLQAAQPVQQPVGYHHGPLFSPLYAHPAAASSSPHLAGLYGESSGLFAGDTANNVAAAAVLGAAYGMADNTKAAVFNQMDLLGITTAQHGLPAPPPLPNHNPLLHGLHHCQVATPHPQLMYHQ